MAWCRFLSFDVPKVHYNILFLHRDFLFLEWFYDKPSGEITENNAFF